MKEKTTTNCTIYPADLLRMKELRDRNGYKNLADSIAFCLTCARRQGVVFRE